MQHISSGSLSGGDLISGSSVWKDFIVVDVALNWRLGCNWLHVEIIVLEVK